MTSRAFLACRTLRRVSVRRLLSGALLHVRPDISSPGTLLGQCRQRGRPGQCAARVEHAVNLQ